jgi:hypothetical protein
MAIFLPSGAPVRFRLDQRMDQAIISFCLRTHLIEVFGSFLVRLTFEPVKRVL